ncbi:MAG: hypothetical protein HFG69_04265 [Hungatella sp.]|nr:hypothetical protein [Hungatella sp.]
MNSSEERRRADMGVIRRLTCPSCQKEWQLRLGHGMRHGVLGRVMEVFSEDIQREIAADVNTEQLSLFHFNYRTALCRKCRSVEAVPVLHLMESGRSYIGICPVCGGEVELLDEDSRIVCPACERDELNEQETGHWD